LQIRILPSALPKIKCRSDQTKLALLTRSRGAEILERMCIAARHF